jgi:hypothetical protein
MIAPDGDITKAGRFEHRNHFALAIPAQTNGMNRGLDDRVADITSNRW